MEAAEVTVPWHAESVEDVMETLDADALGLSDDEVHRRRAEVGRNELDFRPATPAWLVLLKQFWSPLILILIAAAGVTAVLQKWVDTAAIIVVLILNASIGFWQEQRAAAEVRALARLSTPMCRARRSGAEVVLDVRDLVPGDIVLLESGERVPADLRLVDATSLKVDESMLTGEVMAVTKSTATVSVDSGIGDRLGMAFSGTFVVTGRGRGVVVETGRHTELGRINELVQRRSPRTPLQLLTRQLEGRIGIVIGVICALIFVAGLALGGDPGDVFLSAVALAVASIPEALPVVLTIALSIGVARMARSHAVVRTLPAVETLGSTTVIGSDKTGTLTQNLLTVEELWTPNGRSRLTDTGELHPAGDPLTTEVLRAGALTNEARPTADARAGFVGDAVDVAMAAAAVRAGAVSLEEIAATPILHTPYEPELGYSQSVVRDGDGRLMLVVKGAADRLIELSTHWRAGHGDEAIDAADAQAANHDMARRGLRVLATATRMLRDEEITDGHLPPPTGLIFLGLQGMTDPPRPGVADAIAECQDAGIVVVMITGDHPATAEAIADRLGIPRHGPALSGRELARLDDALLATRLREAGVAARVSPQDKLRIVHVLQAQGEIVAVTGDGVNDAPALKAASIGVAMGESGTDVAREAADIVLTDDNFVTIVAAVREGRVTFAAIRKATFFLLSTAAGVILAVTTNVFVEAPLLFLPVQVLWINLVTNGLQDVALAFEPAEGGELERPPRSRHEGLLSRTLWIRLVITGLWMGALVLLTFTWALNSGYSEEHARTLALTLVVTVNFFQAGNSRAEYRSLFSLSPFSNRFLLAAATGSLVLHWGATSWPVSAGVLSLTPLSALEWLACFAIGATVLIVVETEKLVRRYRR